MHAFKYGKKEHFAIDFQVLHKKRDKVFRENRLHNIWYARHYNLLSIINQVLGYQLTLFGPRGADYARHITTGPPIFMDDAASLITTLSNFILNLR